MITCLLRFAVPSRASMKSIFSMCREYNKFASSVTKQANSTQAVQRGHQTMTCLLRFAVPGRASVKFMRTMCREYNKFASSVAEESTKIKATPKEAVALSISI